MGFTRHVQLVHEPKGLHLQFLYVVYTVETTIHAIVTPNNGQDGHVSRVKQVDTDVKKV